MSAMPSRSQSSQPRKHHALNKITRLGIGAAVGAIVAWLVPTPPDAGIIGKLLLAFCVTSLVFAIPLLSVMMRADADRTRDLVHGLDAGRSFVDLIVVVASLASLAGVGMMLLTGSTPADQRVAEAILSLATVGAAWLLIPTSFAMRYARHWFNAQPDSVDLHQDEPPSYSDFVYLAFTVAMTYAISDTDLKTSEIRRIAIRQAGLSYLFGTVIIAASINLLAGLAG